MSHAVTTMTQGVMTCDVKESRQNDQSRASLRLPQVKSGCSQSLLKKDDAVSPSVEPQPPTTASNELYFEDLLNFDSIDTLLPADESKEGSLLEIVISKHKLCDVANQFSIDEDPFQGLGGLDETFSWREISESCTSKSLDELETNPEEQQSYHESALGEYPDSELLEGKISARSWPG